ncbi:Hemolysin activation/secretion protein [Sphingomonas sp. YR710]|uniref:ShlB/FhaC/HecB family hemolysin secretion/activation protein n=1 Tax=Sphingomonas sp. YR710 TaxID=1882773 RepID=UPI0008866A6C|nr:ShlB/FhaC/HecB family hemolysin secretion/activation protein [Sphingomonas sp. YR710]SDC58061.1 Hemolysin activation/secretion protein [Sphingomonas sp. YR710]
MTRRLLPMLAALSGAASQTAIAAAGSAIILPPQGDISRQRVQPLPLPPADYEFRIQNPERSAVPRAVDEVEFSVRSIRIVGATHFSDATLKAFFTRLEGRTIVLDDLRQAAQKLEDLYRAKGFFLTRVFISPQQVKNGVLEVRVLEGFIGAAFVEAPNQPSRNHVEKFLKPVIGQRPAQFRDLEDRLLLINDTPGLSANSVLRQGADPGSSEILVTAAKLPNAYRASFGNTGSETLGPTSYGVGATLNQPFARPGALDIDLSAAGGKLTELRSASLRYATPVGHRGAVLTLGGLLAHARPGGAVSTLDIRSRVISINSRLRVPLLRSRANSVYLDTDVTLNRSKTDALGQPLIDDRTTVAQAGLTWQQADWLKGSTTVTVAVSHGLSLFGAIERSDPLASVQGFRPGFTKLTYSLQRTQGLAPRLSLQFNVQGQYTADRLLSGELISFGGPQLGRGYDPSVVAGDRGLGLLGEAQYRAPLNFGKLADSAVLYGFGDWARTTMLAAGPSPKITDHISSAGFGVRAILYGHALMDMQLADARRTMGGSSGHAPRFNVTLSLFF